MESKKAADILIKFLKKHKLNLEEREAILAAIGTLGWTALSESRLKNKKTKREKDMEL